MNQTKNIMKQLIIKGEAKAYLEDQEGENFGLSDLQLQECNGIEIPDNFADYIDDDIIASKVKSGYTKFVYEDGKLWSVCTYELKASLSQDEIDYLVDYTSGQWSDGIGEGFEQEPCSYINGVKLYISPRFFGQTTSTQIINL